MSDSTKIVSARNIRDFDIDDIQDGEYLVWDGTNFVPTTISGIGGSGNGSASRVVPSGTTITVADTYSLVVSEYYEIIGTLELEGDATLEIL